MSKRGIELYLEDIKEAVEKIKAYTKGMNFTEFSRNSMAIDAVVRNLSVLGEAVKNIPQEIKTTNPDVAWHEIMGMRNKVIHEYFGVDKEILWQTIQKDLPIFEKQITSLSRKLK